MSRPSDLPYFRRPPLVEVVLAAGFKTLDGLTGPQVGVMWDSKLRDRYPKIVEMPRLEGVREDFSNTPNSFEVTIGASPPSSRYWLLNERQDKLLQIQNDWLAQNWRRVDEADEYPRYEAVREDFALSLRTLIQHVDSQGLGSLHLNQCEITYVNHIDEESDTLTRPGSVLSGLSILDRKIDAEVGVEDAKLNWRYFLDKTGARGMARLIVGMELVKDTRLTRLQWRLTLTVRGVPVEDTPEAGLGFLDAGRREIVESFTQLTTPEMHERWERIA